MDDIAGIEEFELHSDQAERALIGAVAFHGSELARVLTSLPSEAFFNPHREYVWQAMRALTADHRPTGPTDVARWLAANDHWTPGVEAVVKREMSEPGRADMAEHHARTLTDLYERRQLLQVVARMRGDITLRGATAAQAVSLAKARLDEILPDAEDPQGPRAWSQLVAEFNDYQQRGDEVVNAVPSPWDSLNHLTGGLIGGRLYVFGGRPGDGKSVAAILCASHAAQKGHKVLVFSQEMSSLEVTTRVFSSSAGVGLTDINKRQLSDFAEKKIRDWLNQHRSLDLRVQDKPASIGSIARTARAQAQRTGLDLLVVDYLQLVKVDEPGRNREQEVGQISRELKLLARELDIAVVVPAQLNRGSELRADKRPTKADLRDSGQIEQDADCVVLLWPQLDSQGARVGLTFIVDKNRHGPRTDIPMNWNGGYSTISDKAPAQVVRLA